MSSEGSASHCWLGNRSKDIALLRSSTDHKMGVDGDCPMVAAVRGETHRTVRQREDRSSMGEIEEVQVFGDDRHFNHHPAVDGLHQADTEMECVAVGGEQALDSMCVHGGDATPGGR